MKAREELLAPFSTLRELDVTSVVVSYLIVDLIRELFEGVQRWYPGQRFVIVDNGSHNEAEEYARELSELPYVEVVFNEHNEGHGPALNKALALADTRFVFTWHTDVVVDRGGFMELMVEVFDRDPSLLACGDARLCYSSETPCVMMHAAMLDREKALLCDPFELHGAVAARFFKSAARRDYRVEGFPITDYVTHSEHSTYGLLGHWNPARQDIDVALATLREGGG